MVPGTVLLPLPLGQFGNVCYSYFRYEYLLVPGRGSASSASTIRGNLYQRKEGCGMSRCANIMRAGRSQPLTLAAVQNGTARQSGRHADDGTMVPAMALARRRARRSEGLTPWWSCCSSAAVRRSPMCRPPPPRSIRGRAGAGSGLAGASKVGEPRAPAGDRTPGAVARIHLRSPGRCGADGRGGRAILCNGVESCGRPLEDSPAPTGASLIRGSDDQLWRRTKRRAGQVGSWPGVR